MLKQEVYEWCSDTFGVSMGMATIISIHERDSDEAKVKRRGRVGFDDELNINGIITDSIEEGKYKSLQRELYRIRDKGYSPKIKEVTIYKRAWKEANNKNDREKGNKKQSSKI